MEAAESPADGALAERIALVTVSQRVADRHGRIDVLAASGADARRDSLGFRLFRDMERSHIDRFIRSH